METTIIDTYVTVPMATPRYSPSAPPPKYTLSSTSSTSSSTHISQSKHIQADVVATFAQHYTERKQNIVNTISKQRTALETSYKAELAALESEHQLKLATLAQQETEQLDQLNSQYVNWINHGPETPQPLKSWWMSVWS